MKLTTKKDLMVYLKRSIGEEFDCIMYKEGVAVWTPGKRALSIVQKTSIAFRMDNGGFSWVDIPTKANMRFLHNELGTYGVVFKDDSFDNELQYLFPNNLKRGSKTI